MFEHPPTALYANSSRAKASLRNNFSVSKMKSMVNPRLLFLYFSMDRAESSGFVVVAEGSSFWGEIRGRWGVVLMEPHETRDK